MGHNHDRLVKSVASRRDFLAAASSLPSLAGFAPGKTARRPLLLVHYMPWFQAKPLAKSWGWHWTMNKANPEAVTDGKPAIASHYHPAIGPYDSSDPAVIECHLLQMRLAGIDGLVIDWYGLSDFRDYPVLHKATSEIVRACPRFGLRFAVCYEDQTIPALETAGKLTPKTRLAHASKELSWLAENWFGQKAYLRSANAPLFLSFGQSGLTDTEWAACLANLSVPVAYFSEHRTRPCARGAFDWPQPKTGLQAQATFLKGVPKGSAHIPVAFPRFEDYYFQAGIGPSHGNIPDHAGKTFRDTLSSALESKSEFVQVATWNDWGEGTQIEPSKEWGYRDLEVLLSLKKSSQPDFPPVPADLRLPEKLLLARRSPPEKVDLSKINEASTYLAQLDLPRARSLLNALEVK